MTLDLSINDISALLMVLFTFVITAANVLLWLATRRNIKLQINSNYSQNHQAGTWSSRPVYWPSAPSQYSEEVRHSQSDGRRGLGA